MPRPKKMYNTDTNKFEAVTTKPTPASNTRKRMRAAAAAKSATSAKPKTAAKPTSAPTPRPRSERRTMPAGMPGRVSPPARGAKGRVSAPARGAKGRISPPSALKNSGRPAGFSTTRYTGPFGKKK